MGGVVVFRFGVATECLRKGLGLNLIGICKAKQISIYNSV